MALHYVSTTGSDSNLGTSSSPVKSITKASQLAKPGDTVLVDGGVYNGLVTINANGTASAPVTFKAQEGEKVVIDGTGTAADTNLVRINGDYVSFQGFEVRDATRSGISLYNAHHTQVLNNNIHDNEKNGIYVGGTYTENHDNLIAGNEVWHNVLDNSARTASGGWDRGIGISHSDRTVVRDNLVHHNYGEGIGILSAVGTKVLHNTSHDNFSVNLYLDNAQSAVAQNNTVYHTYDTSMYRNGKAAWGISISNENTERMLPSSGLVITDNVLGGSGDVRYSTYGANTGLVNPTIARNTVTSPEAAMASLTGTAEDTADTVTFTLGGSDYLGDPQAAFLFDGKEIGRATITADYEKGGAQTVTFHGEFDPDGLQTHHLTVKLLNDKWDGNKYATTDSGHDRNLFVESVTVNDVTKEVDKLITSGSASWDFQV
jgi:Ca-dependent carbohydrate-binding module xylan-binding/Protein of unknown function (DUF1565)